MKGAALFETEVQKPRDDLNQRPHIRKLLADDNPQIPDRIQ